MVALARDVAALAGLASSAGIQPQVADASEATMAGRLLDRYEPEAVILVAGASPLMRPLQNHTLETFLVNSHTEVRIAFNWVREACSSRCGPAAGWS